MDNLKLFFYGIWAKITQFIGVLIILCSGFVFLFSGKNIGIIIIGVIMVIIGISMILYGKAMRFNYKMQSGNIIHRGDW